MIIDIIVILKFYLIFLFNRKRGCPYSVPMSGYGHPIYRVVYIPLNKLYIIDELIR